MDDSKKFQIVRTHKQERDDVGTDNFPVLPPVKSNGSASGAFSSPSMMWYLRIMRPSETHLLSTFKASGYRAVKSDLPRAQWS